MTIDGEPIARSIFIDAYKQNYPNGVSSKKELYHFAERYAEYYLKHKVAAQQQQGITSTSAVASCHPREIGDPVDLPAIASVG